MTPVRFTLVADGTSYRVLLPVLQWLLECHMPEAEFFGQFADPGQLPPSKGGLADRLRRAVAIFSCELLFIHRDAENARPQDRRDEIDAACREAFPENPGPYVCVIPVRMTEAWLLLDESAIRCAAENRSGKEPLELPPAGGLESVPDPKAVLVGALLTASEKSARRKKRLNPERLKLNVVRHMADFGVLRKLRAFRALEADVIRIVADLRHGDSVPEE